MRDGFAAVSHDVGGDASQALGQSNLEYHGAIGERGVYGCVECGEGGYEQVHGPCGFVASPLTLWGWDRAVTGTRRDVP